MSVVIGTWPLSGDFGAVALGEIEATLHACVDHGLRAFDTAPNYGNGFMEHALGRALRGRDVTISSKAGNRPHRGKSFAPEDLRQSVEDSLQRLGSERLDVLFLHNPRTEIVDWEPVLALLDALVAEGKITRRGISLARGTDYPADVLARFDVIQDDANLLFQDRLVRRSAPAPGVAFWARSPLASGILGGHIDASTRFASDDHRAGWLRGERLEAIVAQVDALRATSDLPIAELARRFVLSHPAIDATIFGVKCAAHVEQLAASLREPPIAARQLRELEELWRADFGRRDLAHLGY